MTHYQLDQADIVQWLQSRLWLVRNDYIPKYHAVVGDTPYGLEFMGKKWDKPKPSGSYIRDRSATPTPFTRRAAPESYKAGVDYQAWVTEWASLMLEFVYPGAVMPLFGGTRTYHRLACGLEDAGWEVFDCLMYCYGSGFPKSHAVSNDFRNQRRGGNFKAISNDAMLKRSLRNRAGLLRLERQWETHGSALKPAYEPILLARAPRGKYAYAQLAQQFGTSGLNIDGCRIGTEQRVNAPFGVSGWRELEGRIDGYEPQETSVEGRWPANLIFDAEAAAMLDAQSGESVSSGPKSEQQGANYKNLVYGHGMGGTESESNRRADSGGASRFFYTAKADSSERHYPDGDEWKRVTHPTVKPLDLTRWLATLILPPESNEPRRLLVPFAGVGSEMIGAHFAGWERITGIEQDGDYVAQGRKRLDYWLEQRSIDAGLERIASAVRGQGLDVEIKMFGQLPLFATVGE